MSEQASRERGWEEARRRLQAALWREWNEGAEGWAERESGLRARATHCAQLAWAARAAREGRCQRCGTQGHTADASGECSRSLRARLEERSHV